MSKTYQVVLDFHGTIVAFTIKTDMNPARLKDYLESNPKVLSIDEQA